MSGATNILNYMKGQGSAKGLDNEIADATQTEVDFGTTPVASGIFTVTDSSVCPTSRIQASLAYEAPTDKDLDEVTMDTLTILAGNCGEGSFDIYISATDGSYLEGKFKINYTVSATPV